MKHTLLTTLLLSALAALHAAEPPLNFLLITADDLGYEAVDFLDGKVSGVTPNLSKLASESLSFQHGFVNAAICCPSRSIIATGRYGHNSGLFGFNKPHPSAPTPGRSSIPTIRPCAWRNLRRPTKAAAFFTVGFIDGTCPPSSVYAAFNVIQNKHDIFNDIPTGHANSPAAIAAMRKAILDHVKSVSSK